MQLFAAKYTFPNYDFVDFVELFNMKSGPFVVKAENVQNLDFFGENCPKFGRL